MPRGGNEVGVLMGHDPFSSMGTLPTITGMLPWPIRSAYAVDTPPWSLLQPWCTPENRYERVPRGTHGYQGAEDQRIFASEALGRFRWSIPWKIANPNKGQPSASNHSYQSLHAPMAIWSPTPPCAYFPGIIILGERDFSQSNSPTRFCHLLVAKRRITNYPKSADRVRWPDPPNGCTKCGNPLWDDCVLGPDSRSREGQGNKTGQHPKPRLPLPTNIASLHSSFAHNSAFIAPLLAISRTTHDWQTSGPPPGALLFRITLSRI